MIPTSKVILPVRQEEVYTVSNHTCPKCRKTFKAISGMVKEGSNCFNCKRKYKEHIAEKWAFNNQRI